MISIFAKGDNLINNHDISPLANIGSLTNLNSLTLWF